MAKHTRLYVRMQVVTITVDDERGDVEAQFERELHLLTPTGWSTVSDSYRHISMEARLSG